MMKRVTLVYEFDQTHQTAYTILNLNKQLISPYFSSVLFFITRIVFIYSQIMLYI